MFASEQDRPDVARRRTFWKRYQDRVDPRRLVFIDETWAKTNMTRCHGWTWRGQPLHGKAPFGRWTTMTFLAALRHDRIAAPCLLDGPMGRRVIASEGGHGTLAASDDVTDLRLVLDLAARLRDAGKPEAVKLCQQLIDQLLSAPKA